MPQSVPITPLFKTETKILTVVSRELKNEYGKVL
jgi:hypothetical protein